MQRAVTLLVGTAMALGADALGAQAVLRGVVRDSASGLPIPGAVVSVLDSSRAIAARTLTNERGEYRAMLSGTGVRALRIVRLGFRPVDADIPTPRPDVVVLDVAMARIPYDLQSIQVVSGPGCPRRADRAAALSLLEQARAGLLATVVARSERPAAIKRLSIERRLDPERDSVLQHIVRIDSAAGAFRAFSAAHGAVDFVRHGFAVDADGTRVYYGPDADILLDDDFAAGYCFHVMDANRARPRQVGLGFKAAGRREGRVDVEGALWIDTVARTLVDIEFRYDGLDSRVERFRPGGRVEFRELANGVTLLDRWVLRLVGAYTDSNSVARREAELGGRSAEAARLERDRFVVSEVGGELARATWDDGFTWSASLGTLALTVTTDSGTPAIEAHVRLTGTDYEAQTDSSGRVRIPDLAPGPYSVVVVDRSLDVIAVELNTALSFTATRGETKLLSLRAQSAPRYVAQWCRRVRMPVNGDSFLIGRVTDEDGFALEDVRATLRLIVNGVEHRTRMQSARLGDDGLFAFCGGSRHAIAMLRFEKRGMRVENVTWRLDNPLTVIPIRMVPSR